jgi:hypothetical protein
MAVFTVVTNGYDQGTGYYMDDKLYAFIHCNDEYEKEDILLGVIEKGIVTKVERMDIDDFLDEYDDYFEYPHTLSELKKMMESVS